MTAGELRALSPREASIFACITDTVVAPAGGLPPVRETDAAFALDENLLAAPAVNRFGVRLSLLALEVAPLALRMGARLRRLDPARRTRALERLASSAATAPAVKALTGLAQMSYYGDERVLALLGYDAEAVVRRGRELRLTEARW